MNPRVRSCLKGNLLTVLTITGVVCGILLGVVLRETSNEKWTQREISYVNFLGDLFLRVLKALILPLIISSLISAIGSLDLTLSRTIGLRAIAYYMITTVMAVILGIILVITIKPGVSRAGEDIDGKPTVLRNVTTVDTLLDLVRNMFPPNIVQACIQQSQTVLEPPEFNKNETDLLKWTIGSEFTDNMNVLGLVVAACIFGFSLSALGDETSFLLKICTQLSTAMLKITGWVIWLSPVGVLFLVSAKVLEVDDLAEIVKKLGFYFLTVCGGILFHGFVVLPVIFFLMTKKNPITYIGNMGQALATAFGTSSSSATLPITIKCLEDNNHIDKRVTRFVIPIGSTINMDGTALYEAVAAIFIAQIRGISLSFGNIVAICITATAASIGAAGIPQAGLVTMVMVLDTVGLPAEDVSLIIAVDWLLDRFRTVINVMGDAFGAGIVAHYSQKELEATASDNNKDITSEITHVVDG